MTPLYRTCDLIEYTDNPIIYKELLMQEKEIKLLFDAGVLKAVNILETPMDNG